MNKEITNKNEKSNLYEFSLKEIFGVSIFIILIVGIIDYVFIWKNINNFHFSGVVVGIAIFVVFACIITPLKQVAAIDISASFIAFLMMIGLVVLISGWGFEVDIENITYSFVLVFAIIINFLAIVAIIIPWR